MKLFIALKLKNVKFLEIDFYLIDKNLFYIIKNSI